MIPLPQRTSSLLQVYGIHPFHTDGELLSIGFGTDGTLWSVEDPGVLRQWNPATAEQLAWHYLDDLAILWCFSPGCRWVASGGDELSLWDVTTGEMEAMFSPPSWVTAIAFSPRNNLLASGHDDGIVRLWDLSRKGLLREYPGHSQSISALAFSPDGKSLAGAGEERAIHLWDVQTGKVQSVLLGHTDRIPALVWHPTLPRLISVGWDTTARVWDVARGEPIILLNSHAAQVHTLAINSTGTLLACSDSSHAVHIWDLDRHRTLRVWHNQGVETRSLAFGPDNRQLALGGTDRVIQIKDALQQGDKDSTADPLETRTAVAVSPDGSRVADLGMGTSLRVWEVDSARSVLELQDAGVLRIFALSPDGKVFAGSQVKPDPNEDWTLGLWDAQTGQRKAVLEGQAPPITALAFSVDSRLLASASYRSSDVWLWEVATARAQLLIPGALEGCSVEALAFHPDGNLLIVGGIDWMATGGSDGGVAIWDHVQRRQLAAFGGGTRALAIHPDGTSLATASLVNTAQLWSFSDGSLLAEYEGHSDAVNCVAFSPDGRFLASGSDDYGIRLWNVRSGRLVAFSHLDTQAKALCFSPDNESLFTGNGNTSCYRLSVKQLLAEGIP